ncbi:MAG: hypothetical protein JO257_08990 [Deltaproteobacteria bacterium]|nr:hypothetical protein [Deltaproteobacteria bacterium]
MCALVRRDHDDLDRALGAMVDPRTSPKELAALLDVFRLALAVHTAAEAKVLQALLARVVGPRTLHMLALQTRVEHVAQRAAADALVGARPGSIGWYDGALELRVSVMDHAARAEQTRWTLEDHVPGDVQRVLAGEYATERMRVLASTSPIALARHRDSLLPMN